MTGLLRINFLNREKTETVLFGTNASLSNAPNFQLSIDDSPLKRVSDYKYLGIILSANLSWNYYCYCY